MRVALLTAPPEAPPLTPDPFTAVPIEDLGMGYIAAYLRRAGHDVTIINAHLQDLDISATVERILELASPVLGISISFLTTDLWGSIRTLTALRQSGYAGHIVAGGYTATFLCDYLLRKCPQIDSICLGEGEVTMLDLVDRLDAGEDWRAVAGLAFRSDNGRILRSRRPLIDDLDAIPFPARDMLPWQFDKWDPLTCLESSFGDGGQISVETSRGCYQGCTYCSVPGFFGQRGKKGWRGRSSGNVVDEVEQLIHKWDIHEFIFVDDNFVGAGPRGIERGFAFVEEVLRRGLDIGYTIQCRAETAANKTLMAALIRSGLNHVLIGIESGSQSVLNRYRKATTVELNVQALENVRSFGLRCNAQFIMFDPWTTLTELRETLRFIRQTRAVEMVEIPSNFVNTITPYPGSRIREQIRREVNLQPLGNDPEFEDSTLFYEYNCLDPRVDLVRRAMTMLSGRTRQSAGRLLELQTSILKLQRQTWPADNPASAQALQQLGDMATRIPGWRHNLGEVIVQSLETLVDIVEEDAIPRGGFNRLFNDLLAAHDRAYLQMPFYQFVIQAEKLLDQAAPQPQDGASHGAQALAIHAI